MAAIFELIFLDENCILIQISLKFVPMGSVHRMSALGKTMAWCKTCNEPLFNSLWPSDAIW